MFLNPVKQFDIAIQPVLEPVQADTFMCTVSLSPMQYIEHLVPIAFRVCYNIFWRMGLSSSTLLFWIIVRELSKDAAAVSKY